MLLRSSLLAYSFVKLQPGSYPPVSGAEFIPRSHSLTCNSTFTHTPLLYLQKGRCFASPVNLHLAIARHFYRQKQPGISPGLLSTHTSRNAVEPFFLSRFGCSHHVRVCQKQCPCLAIVCSVCLPFVYSTAARSPCQPFATAHPCGDKGTRTLDLRLAKAPLSQLSYIPRLALAVCGSDTARTCDLALIRGVL